VAFEFRLPDLGEGIAEGELIKWLVKKGDTVEEHQEIAEVETDKAVVQVPSPRAGTILELNASPGDMVQTGEVLCVIGKKGEKPEASKEDQEAESEPEEADEEPKEEKAEESAKAPAKRKRVPAGAVGELEEAPDEPEEEPEAKKTAQLKAPKKKAGPQVKALPAVRKKARELGIDLSTIQGSGPDGRILEKDLKGGKKAEERRAPSVSFEKFGRVLRVPLKGVRKTIAENMSKSLQTAAHVTHTDMIDVTALAKIRSREKKVAEKKGVKLTYLPFIVKACVLALKKFPYVNASLDDEAQDIVLKQYYNVGIAVDTQHGLMVPVVKHADARTIFDVAKEIWRMAELARTREIQLKDLQGGTFTITNVGSIGGWFATPVINHPEAAILALGRIQEMVMPIEDALEVRKMLPVSLSFDHRIIDGALAAKFVNEVKVHLENPDALFMGY